MSCTPSRRGFTVAETLVVMVVMAIIGVAFTGLVVRQSRFYQHEFGRKSSRAVSRSAMNLLVSDLRMVQDSGGVDSVSSDARTVRVIAPFAYGLICGKTGSVTVASLLPIDSTETPLAQYGGYAWRDVNNKGRYTIVTPTAPSGADSVTTAVSAATALICTGTGVNQAGMRTVTINGRTGRVVTVTPQAASAIAGEPMFLWQKITYSFAPSTAFPGLYGLWRNTEEIMAPFDTSARFTFYVPGQDSPQTTIPAIGNIRGFDVLLNAVSPTVTPGMSRTVIKTRTTVFFKSTRTF
jgi:prepilin-type N-terminal cleavage/methylation domain-containing protein